MDEQLRIAIINHIASEPRFYDANMIIRQLQEMAPKTQTTVDKQPEKEESRRLKKVEGQ